MKILYDYEIFTQQRFGGISRYFIEIYNRIITKKKDSAEIRVIGNKNHYYANIINTTEDVNKHSHLYMKILTKINQFITLLRVSFVNYDIIHPTYYSNYIFLAKKSNIVITVYDMIHELFMKDDSVKLTRAKRNAIIKSNRIIAISESTKRDLLYFYPEIPEDKIDVIYISTDMVKSSDRTPKETYGDYILFVGRRDGYKNFETFLEACIPILVENKNISIVCAGGGKFKNDEIKCDDYLKDRIIQIDCNDAELSALYSNAECFVFPSKYEGFGIPTLEAFSCDCPVVLSNTSSMPEVGGDAVEYCDPNNVTSIRDAIERVLNSPERRNELILKGRKQRKKFDWDTITEQTLDCYRKVIETNGFKK